MEKEKEKEMDDALISVSLEPSKRSQTSIASRWEHTQNWTPQVCLDGMSRSHRSRAPCPSLCQRATLSLEHVADDHQTLQLLPFPHRLVRANSARLQRLTLHRIRYWNTDAARPPYVADSKHGDLERHHVLANRHINTSAPLFMNS